MDQINKPVPNSHIGRYLFVVYWHLYCFVFFCAQSFTSDKTNDRDTSYFYVSKQNAICDLSLFWCLGKADFSLFWRLFFLYWTTFSILAEFIIVMTDWYAVLPGFM